ncbi:uncharacterized protein LOC126734877 [Anthonomus grandis grandis]|uniref:uncharacterized protein LOC126734877 n=1 Tax=Anthonomus grandis grandis TaxID=2921223 RepID=UPI0021658D3F|nr:uncharacterized protein LOC126734877 [Anthonomus grandis grandis]
MQRPGSKLRQPGSSSQSGLRQPSTTKAQPGADTTKKDGKDQKTAANKTDKTLNFKLPPLSVVGKKKEIDFEYIRKKVIRRGNPEGEDKKQLASILKHLKDSKVRIKVFEFVNLVAKFTSDNGECMRRVLEEDLAMFRKMVTKVYENMTQDVSDVLVNEQIQTNNFYQERYDMYNNKMLVMISEIFQMIPEFDFEKYARDKDDFLNYVCPMPQLIKRTDEDVETQRRQEAFHRLQWLKIEEDRLAEENKRLEERLEQLKYEHKTETQRSTMKATIMEQKQHDLEKEEQDKQKHLNQLEDLLGKNIIRTEAYIRLEEDEAIRMAKPLSRDAPSKSKAGKRTGKKKPEWSVETAKSIEEESAQKLQQAESARADERKRTRKKELLVRRTSKADYASTDVTSAAQLQERSVHHTVTTSKERRPGRPGGGCGGGCQ